MEDSIMKRYFVTIVSIALVLAVTWVTLGQAEGERSERGEGRRRRGMRREEQLKAIAAIEGELAKIKTGLESFSGARESWQDLSDEERDELRDKFRKVRGEQQQSVTVIEEQLPKLKGERQLRAEHEESIGKLNAIRELAVKEKATETAASIEKMIAEQKKEFEDGMEKLGLEPRPRDAND
jgi:hypothetical protein